MFVPSVTSSPSAWDEVGDGPLAETMSYADGFLGA